MVKHYELRYETDYIAKLREQAGECTEAVFFNGEQIHRATFPASNLGSAKRGEYLGCMVASVAREHRGRLAEAERIQAENLARVSSPEYRRQERKVAKVERAMRRENGGRA